MSGHEMQQSAKHTQSGFALIFVLWIVVLLGLIAVTLTTLSRSDVSRAINLGDGLAAELAADSALETAVLALLLGDTDAWHPDGTLYFWRIGNAEVRVVVTDETLRTDLNRAPVEALQALFARAGANSTEAPVLAKAVDRFRKETRAEQRATLTEEQRLAAGEYDFGLVEEISAVPGVSPELAQRVLRYATVYSGLPEPSDTRPPPAPGQYPPPHALESLATTPTPFSQAEPDGKERVSSIYRIQAEALSESGAHFAREAVITLAPTDGVSVYSRRMWRRGERFLFPLADTE